MRALAAVASVFTAGSYRRRLKNCSSRCI